MVRPTGKLTAKRPEPAEAEPSPARGKPDLKQFRLQVDRQTKSSYDTMEAAEAAGLAIKTAHPVVQVSIYDAGEGVTRLVTPPQA